MRAERKRWRAERRRAEDEKVRGRGKTEIRCRRSEVSENQRTERRRAEDEKVRSGRARGQRSDVGGRRTARAGDQTSEVSRKRRLNALVQAFFQNEHIFFREIQFSGHDFSLPGFVLPLWLCHAGQNYYRASFF